MVPPPSSRRAPSGQYGPTAAHRSDPIPRHTEQLDTPREPTANDVILAELRATRAHVAESEGRVLAALSDTLASVSTATSEQDTARLHGELVAAAETRAGLLSRVERMGKHRGWAIAGVVALAIVEAVTQWMRGSASDVAAARAEQTAEVTAKRTASEVVEEAGADTEGAEERIDAIEVRLDGFEEKLDAIIAKLTPADAATKRALKRPK